MSVHIEGRLLGFIDRLEDCLKIGDQVTVDLAVNAADASGHPYIQGSPGRYVARAVFKEQCLILRSLSFLPYLITFTSKFFYIFLLIKNFLITVQFGLRKETIIKK